MNFNKATIVGRLTRDPETRSMPNGNNVTNFSMATNRIWNDNTGNRQESTDYHNIVVFGKLADICAQYLKKGQLALIEGRIQTRTWDDKDGKKNYRTEIVADTMQMGPKAGGQSNINQQAPMQDRSPDPKDAQDDIPVIDSDEPFDNSDSETAPDAQESDKDSQGVNVGNIPF